MTFPRIIIFLSLASMAYPHELPEVRFIDCAQIPVAPLNEYNKCLEIAFSSGTDYAGLSGSETILSGSVLKNDGSEDEESHVSLTKESKMSSIALVMIATSDDLYKMKVDFESGKASKEILAQEESSDFDDPQPNPNFNASMIVSSRKLRKIRKSGYILRVQWVCDSSCKKKFGTSKDVFEKIITHANTFFAHKSLGTRIKLQALPTIKYIDDHLYLTYENSGGNLDTFRGIVRASSWPDADSYSLLTVDENLSGTAGIGGMPVTCDKDRSQRVNINEYQRDEINTAQTLVHEIGHNLGMKHDFNRGTDGSRNPRYSSDKKKCTGVGGYMDYYNEETRWSLCSREDLQNYYNAIVAERGGCFCLAHLKGKPCKPRKVKPAPCVDKMRPKGTCDKSRCAEGIDYTEKCMDTCGNCPFGPISCENRYSNCEDLVAKDPDVCKFGDSAWSRDLRLMCRKACKLCKKGKQKPYPPSKCLDKSKKCDKSKCSSGYDYMAKCLATCGNCRGGSGACYDYWSNCGDLVTDMLCKYGKTDWAWKLKVRCRKSCKLCK